MRDLIHTTARSARAAALALAAGLILPILVFAAAGATAARLVLAGVALVALLALVRPAAVPLVGRGAAVAMLLLGGVALIGMRGDRPEEAADGAAAAPPAPTRAAADPAEGCRSGTASAAGTRYRVVSDALNLRTGPGTGFERVADRSASAAGAAGQPVQLDAGTEVQELCRDGEWSRVRVIRPDGGRTGWVANRFLGGL